MKSEYKLLQFSKKNLHLVEPVQHVLGVNCKGKEDTFHYVPLKDVLKVYLEKEDIFDSFQRHCEKAPSSLLEDFTNGNIFQACPFFGDPNILHIHL